MNPALTAPSILGASAPTATRTSTHRWLAALLVLEALLAFAPVLVLGPAIGWPASLRAPASQQLQAIAAQPGALAAGYGIYLAYSILIAPALIGLAYLKLGGLARPLAFSVAVFAALSTLARAVGILRWLTVMPVLARQHAVADGPARAAIERLFEALTLYGGGIGEVLGVGVFMSLALGLLCIGAWRAGQMHAAIAGLGLLTAGLLAGIAAPAFGLRVNLPIAVGATLLSMWMLVVGASLLRTPGPRAK